MVQPAAQLSEYLIASSKWTRIGFGYSAAILLFTLIVRHVWASSHTELIA